MLAVLVNCAVYSVVVRAVMLLLLLPVVHVSCCSTCAVYSVVVRAVMLLLLPVVHVSCSSYLCSVQCGC